MPRKRQYNTVRTETFENRIAHYEATRNYEAAAALRWLADSCGAPINEDKIAASAASRREFYTSQDWSQA